MASKSRVNDYLLLVFGLRELDEEDLRGEVVDVRDSKSHERFRELVSYDLALLVKRSNPIDNSKLTFTSKEENLCFMLWC